ncbi:MAG: tRNA (adenosine(37)-N6)-threonylcarbamoyltransferase complex ATPase subunit type 1 TsaE [bacterium]
MMGEDEFKLKYKKKELVSESPQETIRIGIELGKRLRRGTFVALCGELGSGKTVFVKGIAEGMGVSGVVLSPTFQIVREYPGAITLFHLDFYRLRTAAEAIALDIEGYLERGVVAAEWADRFPELVFSSFVEIRFFREGENKRRIVVQSNMNLRY